MKQSYIFLFFLLGLPNIGVTQTCNSPCQKILYTVCKCGPPANNYRTNVVVSGGGGGIRSHKTILLLLAAKEMSIDERDKLFSSISNLEEKEFVQQNWNSVEFESIKVIDHNIDEQQKIKEANETILNIKNLLDDTVLWENRGIRRSVEKIERATTTNIIINQD